MVNEPLLEDFYTENRTSSVGKLNDFNHTVSELASTNDYWQKVAEAVQKNNEVPATHSFEENEKDMNALFLDKIVTQGTDRFNEEQTAQILALAQACPFTQGKAVYLARVLYSLIDPAVIFSDDAACEVAYKKAPDNSTVEAQTTKYAYISPNPSGTQTNLFLNLEEQEKGELLLLDLTGRVVMAYTIVPDKTIQIINLAGVNAGAYVYSIQTQNGFTYTGKLTVVK